MPKGPLRQAIEDFFYTNFTPQGGPGWWSRVTARSNQWKQAWGEVMRVDPWFFYRTIHYAWAVGIIYELTGASWALEFLTNRLVHDEDDDLSTKVADTIAKALKTKGWSELAQTLGAVFSEPVLSQLEYAAQNPDIDPKEFARTFNGIIMELTLAGGAADTLVETITGGQVEGAGRLFNSIYWSLGLGFLGWQILAPLLESGLQPRLDRHYKKLSRPARFSASELRDLFALGEISEAKLRDEAAYLGWREENIAQWIKLAYRVLSEADIWKALYAGHISENEAVKRLRAKGYDPRDIPLLFKINPPPDTDEVRSFTVSNARTAFRESLIAESELRSILNELNYSDREIQVIVAIEKHRQEQDARALTIAQVKSAWEENVLSEAEARHWLTESGLDEAAITVLMRTWKAEAVPAFRKLNLGTITGAYVEGILTRTQAKSKLIDIGFTEEDASLELDLTERRNPEAFGKPVPQAKKVLTPGTLSDLVSVGLITPDQMADRLVELGYSQSDADLLAEAARIRATPAARLMPQRSIERAYAARVIDYETAIDKLIDLGFDLQTAQQIVATVEVERAKYEDISIEEKVKVLTPGVLTDLVVAGLITPGDMNTRLLELGYGPIDADLLTGRAIMLAEPPVRALSQGTIERAYLAGVLDRTRAYEQLIGLDFTPENANNILATVEAENPDIFNPTLVQSTRQPTLNALLLAVQNSIITEQEYLDRAIELGYSQADANLYLTIATRNERKSTKQLTPTQVINAYGAGFLDWGTALSRVVSYGYSDNDAILLLRMEKDRIQNTDAWAALLAGEIDAWDCLSQLINARYADRDILDAFAALPPTALAALGIDLETLKSALAEIPGGQ